MLAVTIAKGVGYPWIDVTEGGSGKLGIYLGAKGSGSIFQKIELANKNPAEVHDGKMSQLRISTRPKANTNEKFFVAERSNNTDPPYVIVRINTQGTPDPKRPGRYEIIEGSPREIVSVLGATATKAGKSTWVDALVEMKPGDVLKVEWQGRTYTDLVLLFDAKTQKIEGMPYARYLAEQAA